MPFSSLMRIIFTKYISQIFELLSGSAVLMDSDVGDFNVSLIIKNLAYKILTKKENCRNPDEVL